MADHPPLFSQSKVNGVHNKFPANRGSLRRCYSDRPISSYAGRARSLIGKENMAMASSESGKKHPMTRKASASGKPLERLDTDNSQWDYSSEDESLDSTEGYFPFDSNNNQDRRAPKSCPAGTVNSEIRSGHVTPPLSPNWNLKMLCTAVSPEIRRMQQERENSVAEGRLSSASAVSSSTTATTIQLVSPSEENSQDGVDFVSSQDSTITLELEVITSRKDKSLGKLCDK